MQLITWTLINFISTEVNPISYGMQRTPLCHFWSSGSWSTRQLEICYSSNVAFQVCFVRRAHSHSSLGKSRTSTGFCILISGPSVRGQATYFTNAANRNFSEKNRDAQQQLVLWKSYNPELPLAVVDHFAPDIETTWGFDRLLVLAEEMVRENCPWRS